MYEVIDESLIRFTDLTPLDLESLSRSLIFDSIVKDLGELSSFDFPLPCDSLDMFVILVVSILMDDYSKGDILGSELGILHACRYLRAHDVLRDITQIVVEGESIMGVKLWYILSNNRELFEEYIEGSTIIEYSVEPENTRDMIIGFHHSIPLDIESILNLGTITLRLLAKMLKISQQHARSIGLNAIRRIIFIQSSHAPSNVPSCVCEVGGNDYYRVYDMKYVSTQDERKNGRIVLEIETDDIIYPDEITQPYWIYNNLTKKRVSSESVVEVASDVLGTVVYSVNM